MDIAEYVDTDPGRIHSLARRSCIPILRLRRLIADPSQAMRYMTARRIVEASDGQITMEALAARGPMRGKATYAGPLGEVIAEIASTGKDVAGRLAAAGIPADHLHDMLLRGRMPTKERMALYIEAFGPKLKPRHFAQHVAWRRAS